MAAAPKIRQVQLVGRGIRQLRKKHNLSQTELSSRIGIQQSDLSRMEKGEYRVSLDTLFRILATFGVSIGDFFENLAHENPDQSLIRDLGTPAREAARDNGNTTGTGVTPAAPGAAKRRAV